MENSDTKCVRSKLFTEIVDKLKLLKLDNSNGQDCYDVNSVAVELENMFIQKMKQEEIGNEVKGNYYIQAKVVTTGTLMTNDNMKLVEQLQKIGFKYEDAPITQTNEEAAWTFLKKTITTK